MKHPTLPALTALGFAVTAALTGCIGPADVAKQTPEPTINPEAPPAVNECIDGSATLLASEDGSAISLPGGCETVYVVASDQTIELGPTTTLIFEGTGNTVTVTGGSPSVGGTVEGDGNTVTTR